MDHTQERYREPMTLAIHEAALAAATGDLPIGALVLDAHGTVIARAHNQREALQDPTAHAEVLALRAAAGALGDWHLTDCTLVVTLEPCPMCAGAAVLSRVGRIVFGAWNEEYGACGSHWDLPRDRRMNHRPEVVAGVLADECGTLVRGFMAGKRSQEDA
ncbi:MAG: nucleoside deaminase [Candidatus Nanopelagicales bacterium]|nr:nucleoside deaminase [Candidatus Nanopelagicales bacterium]